jgi:hypothetical protein
MSDKSIEKDAEEVAAAYLRYSAYLGRSARVEDDVDPEGEADQWAYDEVEGTVRSGPASRAWALVSTVIRLAPENRVHVEAAGPLEDLVRLRGAELVSEIEAEAVTDENFRWALGNIWLGTSDLPEDILTRVVAASGGKIRPLDHGT